MSYRYVIRALGSTLRILIGGGTPQPMTELITLKFRDGHSKLVYRDGQAHATFRDGIGTDTSR